MLYDAAPSINPEVFCLMRHFFLTLLLAVAPDVMVVGQKDVWYVGQENVKLDCRANANPPPQHFYWTRYHHHEVAT